MRYIHSTCIKNIIGLDTLPEKPGVYIVNNCDGDVIYIGMSRNIHKRLNGPHHKAYAINSLQNPCTVDFEICKNKRAAREREGFLISHYKPILNTEKANSRKIKDGVLVTSKIPSELKDWLHSEFPGVEMSKIIRIILTEYRDARAAPHGQA